VLARAASRNVEMAIRQSIGAGRGRLIRQLLTENLLLSGAGALGGLAFAYWCTRLLMAVQLPVPFPLALNLPIYRILWKGRRLSSQARRSATVNCMVWLHHDQFRRVAHHTSMSPRPVGRNDMKQTSRPLRPKLGAN
jgi:FtsX-like permease family